MVVVDVYDVPPLSDDLSVVHDDDLVHLRIAQVVHLNVFDRRSVQQHGDDDQRHTTSSGHCNKTQGYPSLCTATSSINFRLRPSRLPSTYIGCVAMAVGWSLVATVEYVRWWCVDMQSCHISTILRTPR